MTPVLARSTYKNSWQTSIESGVICPQWTIRISGLSLCPDARKRSSFNLIWTIEEKNMGTLKIAVSNNASSATYSKTSGPGTVSPAGEINFAGQGAGQESIEWTLSNGTFSSPPITMTDQNGNGLTNGGEFSWPTTGGTNTLTITDQDDPGGTQYNYCLNTSGGTLDPKIINRQ